MISSAEVSQLLLRLYRASRQLPMQDFQRCTLEELRPFIPFDTVWWAMVTQLDNGEQHVHDSYIVGIPEDSADLLNSSLRDNVIAQTCSFSPGVSFSFSPEQISQSEQTAKLARHMDIAHVLCIRYSSEIPQLSAFLSFGRRDPECHFQEHEQLLHEWLMPHLTDMLHNNVVMQFAAICDSDSEARSARAVVDEMGMLLVAESGFERLVHLEWPGWEGPFLPPPLLTILATTRERHVGKSVLTRIEQVHESKLVTVVKRSPRDQLSTRETDVAEGFSSGETYKQVAKRLGISPATVRHHLRTIYEKLGISDKAALATLLADTK